jgi:ABC-type lipoprotein export system ATPase subunit
MKDNSKDTVIIKAAGLQQKFAHGNNVATALKEATFTINKDSCNIIFGPSGSGKSTLLNIISGVQRPTAGRIIINGQDIYRLSPDDLSHFRAREIGFIYQTNFWVKSLNVIENVSVPLFFLGYSKKKAHGIALKALARVGLESYAKKNPIHLSSGEQQRVAAARALVNNPQIIIADEPTGNLDTANGDRIMSLLMDNQIRINGTLIIVTHNMEYLALADHLLRVQDGVLEDIKPAAAQGIIDTLVLEVKYRVKELLRMKQHAKK